MIEQQVLTRTQDSRITKLEAAILQNDQLLNLLKEVEALKAEIARLRGADEVLAHQLDSLEKRQKDLYVDLDHRLAELSKPLAVEAPGVEDATPTVDPLQETSSYETALSLFKSRKYTEAISGFREFLKAYPASTLAPNAQYWIGYSFYAMKDYKGAIAQQQKLLAVYPASPKIPDALLNIASNQIELGNRTAAKKTLEEIVSRHGGSNAATIATKRLATFKK